MERDSGSPLGTPNVDGGACASDLLMQTQSDICAVTVRRPRCVETTAMGAAVGAIKMLEGIDITDLRHRCATDREFSPNKIDDIDNKINMWNDAINKT